VFVLVVVLVLEIAWPAESCGKHAKTLEPGKLGTCPLKLSLFNVAYFEAQIIKYTHIASICMQRVCSLLTYQVNLIN